jgi:type II secretory pathway component PulF
MSESDVQVILRRLDDQDRRLERIERQTEKTNGRVSRLEQARAFADGAKAAMNWVQPAVIAVVTGVVIAAVIALLGLG